MVGHSPEMEKLYRIIAKAAHSTHPVLILGESGTGKELVARSIHYAGPLKDKPFIPVDCGSLVPTLIESELFGYVRGAFTGAVRSRKGCWPAPKAARSSWMRSASCRSICRPSCCAPSRRRKFVRWAARALFPINVRILAATNRDLDTAVSQGTFRRDLYFRLNVLTLRIPPLRERKQDIPAADRQRPGAHQQRHANAAHGRRRRPASDAELRLAGQCARTGKLHRACLYHLLAAYHSRDRPAHATA